MAVQHPFAEFRPEYGYDVFLHDGIAYTPDASPELIRNIEDFPVDDRDVIVVGYPKSGTNWLNITLANLYHHWQTTQLTPNNVVPELSVPNQPEINFYGYQACIASPPPRLMKSHLPFELMPRAFREGVGKVIYIKRNPRDVCDSYYNNLKPYFSGDWSWDRHVEAFLEGRVYFGSWLRNVLSWADKGVEQKVLHISYEQMQQDKRGTVERIVDFVGPVDAGAIDRVIGATDFEAMKANGLDKQFQPSMTRREGKVGGWKQHFTVAQHERFAEVFDEPLRERGIVVNS